MKQHCRKDCFCDSLDNDSDRSFRSKRDKRKDIYSHKCISVSSEGIVPVYFQIPLANSTREWCHIGDSVSFWGNWTLPSAGTLPNAGTLPSAGSHTNLGEGLCVSRLSIVFFSSTLHFASVPMSNCWHRWRKKPAEMHMPGHPVYLFFEFIYHG